LAVRNFTGPSHKLRWETFFDGLRHTGQDYLGWLGEARCRSHVVVKWCRSLISIRTLVLSRLSCTQFQFADNVESLLKFKRMQKNNVQRRHGLNSMTVSCTAFHSWNTGFCQWGREFMQELEKFTAVPVKLRLACKLCAHLYHCYLLWFR